MAIANVLVQTIVFDDLTHVLLDFFRRCNGGADPWLEAVAKCVEIAVGAHTGVRMHMPRSPEGLVCLKNHE